MFNVICEGDTTSHGGKVVTSSSTSDTNGRRWALLGDMVACPKCHGIFPIIQGNATNVEDGKPVAYDGCKTACGAVLIAGQSFTTTDPNRSGNSAGASMACEESGAPAGYGSIGKGLAANYEERPTETQSKYLGRFRIVDIASGNPVAGQSIRVRSTGGAYLTGTTDTEGYTGWVTHSTGEALAMDLLETPSA